MIRWHQLKQTLFSILKFIVASYVLLPFELYDTIRWFWAVIKGENYIGRYIRVMSKIERKLIFSSLSRGGGYVFHFFINIFFDDFKEIKKRYNVTIEEIQMFSDIITHETLHQVLKKIREDSKSLDNVHMMIQVGNVFIMDFIDRLGGLKKFA